MNLELLEKELNIKITKQIQEKFDIFEQLFKIYNSHTNLISKNDEKNFFEKHIYDSLSLNKFLEKYNIKGTKKILDIGTGGGFPAIPLAIVYPEFDIYPVDSIAKKIGFIEMIQKELRLKNLHPECIRVEEFPKDKKEFFDIAVSRAVAPLNILLEYAVPFVKTEGYFIAYKAKNATTEIEQAKNALVILNSAITDRIEYALPTEISHKRELVAAKKTAATPAKYPRKSGQAKKFPL